MKKIFAAFTAMVLSLNMISSTMAVGTVKANEVVENNNPTISQGIDDMSIKSTNSFGELFSKNINEKLSEQKANNGYNIFSIEMSEKEAKVSFEAVNDCNLVVAVFDEDGNKMLASGNLEVLKGEKEAVVTIDINSMPKYFYLKAFLVDSSTLKPLCSVYESPNYTQEMQEFLAKTTDDFNSEKVLNFDNDKTNNFAVYNDKTKLIPENTGKNKVVAADDIKNTYIIENIDSSIKSLTKGDTFAYNYNNDILIVKVADIKINGTTATITGEDTSIDEVFDFVKIDTTSDLSEASIDTSTCSDGVTLKKEKINRGIFATRSINTGGSVSRSFTYELKDETYDDSDDDEESAFSGSLDLDLEVYAKLYISLENNYFELAFNYSAGVNIGASKEFGPKKLKLGTIGFSPVAGVIIDLTPSLVLKAECNLVLSGTLEGTVGFRASTSNSSIENISTIPNFKTEIKGEVEAFVGLSLEPKIRIISEKIISAKLEGTVGIEASAELVSSDTLLHTDDEVHECDMCIDGSIEGKLSLSFEVEFLKLKKFNFKLDILDISVEVCSFYFSIDFCDFGLGECPHYTCKVTVTVVDQDGNKITGAKVKSGDKEYLTKKKGEVSFYLSKGKNTITASKTGVGKGSYKINLEEPKKIKIVLKKPHLKAEKTKGIVFGPGHSAFITENGDLYMWGINGSGQLGDGTINDNLTPHKIMENVVSVSLGAYHSAAITKNGDLYTWGNNNYGQLGDGTTNGSCVPKKVESLKNVVSVSLGDYYCAALTKDGDLYTWGRNDKGQLGNGTGTPTKVLEPNLIMSNVISLYCGPFQNNAAITQDNDLYIFGYHFCEKSYIPTPKKIMEDIDSVAFGAYHSMVLTKDGELYTWGYNLYAQIGNGTIESKYIPYTSPYKVMDNVKSINASWTQSGALTKDGVLYTWGENSSGRCGQGNIEKYILVPKKILSNVNSFNFCYNSGCALTKDGQMYVWGANGHGQLGIGNGAEVLTPTPVSLNLDNSTKSATQTYSTSQLYSVTTPQVNGVDTNIKSFTNLLPNSTYNFYIMKSKYDEDALNSDNLLYIAQSISDSNGNMSISYGAKEEYEDAEYFVVSGTQIDISGAKVKMDDLLANGEEQFAEPTVTFNGVTLVEGRDYELLRDYSVKDVGNYTLKIIGIGFYNGSINFNYKVLCNYDLTPLVNNSTVSSTSINLGSSVSLTAKANGGTAPYKYKYFYKPAGSTSYTALTNTTTSATYTHKPDKAMKYSYAVKIADAKGKTSTKYFNVTVNTPPLTNKSTISETAIVKGDVVKLTAKASGGKAPYKYKYYCKPAGDSKYTALTNTTTKTTYTHKPARAIKYNYAVKIADANGKISTKYFTVVVNNPLTNKSTISETEITKGNSIRMTAKASGGIAPYKYKYYCKPAGSSKYTALTGETTKTTYTHKPARSIEYKYAVKIIDSKGTTKTKYFTVKVNSSKNS